MENLAPRRCQECKELPEFKVSAAGNTVLTCKDELVIAGDVFGAIKQWNFRMSAK